MRAVGSWLVGLGAVQAGGAVVRGLVALLPKSTVVRDPPLWAAGVLLASAAAHIALGRRWLAGRTGGAIRGLTAGSILAWLLLSLVSVNTATIDPDAPQNGSILSLSALWRGAGWPSMLSIADGYAWRPSGQWRPLDVVLAGLTLAIGLALLGRVLASRTPSLAPAPRPRGGAGLLGIAVALHLAILAFLTIAVLVGLSFRVVGSEVP